MEYKYIMNMGLAFDEDKAISKLEKLGMHGWILESFSHGGLFYKLRKSAPIEISYSIDYQKTASSEYFDLFKAAGWSHVVTAGNDIHIFSAPKGTTPIYSDKESEADKYMDTRSTLGKGLIVALISTILFTILTLVTDENMALNLTFFILLVLSVVITIPCLMTYIGFTHRIHKLKK